MTTRNQHHGDFRGKVRRCLLLGLATFLGSIIFGAGLSAELVREWTPIFKGVAQYELSLTEPRPLEIRVIRVALYEPTIDFLVTPSNGSEPRDTGARLTSEFLEEFGCQVAINGSAFEPFARQRGEPQSVLGLSLSRGDLYSDPSTADYDALLISRDRRARIEQPPINVQNAYNGLSGFKALIMDGHIVVNDDSPPEGTSSQQHPRSAVGITEDNRYLILMTIDGRHPGYSEGTTLLETAQWMARFNAFNALNLDGGGSTTLVIEGADGKAHIVNRPVRDRERLVANHLGVFAKRLPLSDAAYD